MLWNRCKFIVFNISLCGILIISFKLLIITVISNETISESTIQAILSRSVTLFHWQWLTSLFKLQGKLKADGNSKKRFSWFSAGDGHRTWCSAFWTWCSFTLHGVQILWKHTDSIFYWIKVPQTCFWTNQFNWINQSGMLFFKFSFALNFRG